MDENTTHYLSFYELDQRLDEKIQHLKLSTSDSADEVSPERGKESPSKKGCIALPDNFTCGHATSNTILDQTNDEFESSQMANAVMNSDFSSVQNSKLNKGNMCDINIEDLEVSTDEIACKSYKWKTNLEKIEEELAAGESDSDFDLLSETNDSRKRDAVNDADHSRRRDFGLHQKGNLIVGSKISDNELDRGNFTQIKCNGNTINAGSKSSLIFNSSDTRQKKGIGKKTLNDKYGIISDRKQKNCLSETKKKKMKSKSLQKTQKEVSRLTRVNLDKGSSQDDETKSEESSEEESLFDEFMDQTTKKRIITFKKKVTMLEVTSENLKKQNQILTEERQQLRIRVQKGDSELRSVKNALGATRKMMSATEKKSDNSRGEVERVRKENANLRKEIAEMKNKVGKSAVSTEEGRKLRHLQEKLLAVKKRSHELETELQAKERNYKENDSAHHQKHLMQQKQIQQLELLNGKQRSLIDVLKKQKVNLLAAKMTQRLEERFMAALQSDS